MWRKITRYFLKTRLGFYYLNLRWNASFWLNSRKMYKVISVTKKTGDFSMDEVGKMNYVKVTKNKKRFVGYSYKENIYFDNPGFRIEDRELWESWKSKNLIK